MEASKLAQKKALQFDSPKILRSHSSPYHKMVQLALEFAVLGQLDTARSLVALINKHNPKFHQASVQLKPLWLIWNLENVWPDDERDNVDEDLDELEKEFSQTLWHFGGVPETKAEYGEESLRFCVREYEMGHEGRVDNLEWGGELIGGWERDKMCLLAKMLEIAIAMQEKGEIHEGLPSVEEVLGWIGKRLYEKELYNLSHRCGSLAKAMRAWGLLKGGALPRALGLQDDVLKQLGEKAVATFKERLENGPQESLFANKSMADLVKIISDSTSKSKAARNFYLESYWKEDEIPKTLLRDPLASAAIADLETRLDVSLPQDFKEFLAVTNGLGESWTGVLLTPPLHAAQDVRWLGNDPEDYMTDIISNVSAELLDVDIFLIDGDLEYDTCPKINRAIDLGHEDVDFVFYLPRDAIQGMRDVYLEARKKDKKLERCIHDGIRSFIGTLEEFEKLEWCVLCWHTGPGMEAYPSFRTFLEAKAEESQNGYLMDNTSA